MKNVVFILFLILLFPKFAISMCVDNEKEIFKDNVIIEIECKKRNQIRNYLKDLDIEKISKDKAESIIKNQYEIRNKNKNEYNIECRMVEILKSWNSKFSIFDTYFSSIITDKNSKQWQIAKLDKSEHFVAAVSRLGFVYYLSGFEESNLRQFLINEIGSISTFKEAKDLIDFLVFLKGYDYELYRAEVIEEFQINSESETFQFNVRVTNNQSKKTYIYQIIIPKDFNQAEPSMKLLDN